MVKVDCGMSGEGGVGGGGARGSRSAGEHGNYDVMSLGKTKRVQSTSMAAGFK